MANIADISSKRLISLLPEEWARWVTGQEDVVAGEPVAAEFQFISRQTDALVLVTSVQQGRFLLLTEVQLRYQAEMPYRMNAYAGLAAEKFRLPVFPVLVNILPPSPATEIPSRYESVWLGLTSRQDYQVINLWEVEAETVLSRPVPVAAPFVPVMRGGDTVEAVRRAAELVQADERLRDFEGLLGLLASIKLKTSIVEQIVRLDMSVVRETNWFEEALAEGMQRGLQGMQHQLVRVLQHRFGPVPEQLQDRLRQLDADRLTNLIDVALDAQSLDEFARHLPLPNDDAEC